jgi:hypothetical protein
MTVKIAERLKLGFELAIRRNILAAPSLTLLSIDRNRWLEELELTKRFALKSIRSHQVRDFIFETLTAEALRRRGPNGLKGKERVRER